MPYNLPGASVPYSSPIISLPALWDLNNPAYVPPPEGSRFVAFEILWSAYAGGVAAANVFGNTPSGQLSRIVALSVDNVDCGSQIDFVFPDTAEVLSIPPYTSGTFPVFTGSTNFYVVATGSDAADVTRWKCHNTMPPPVAIAADELQSVASINSVALNANSTTPVIAAGISGTLETIAVYISSQSTVAASVAATSLVDGAGKVLLNMGPAGLNPASFVIPSLKVRFTNGISYVVAAATLNATADVHLYYRTP